jgi:drug/metabolite transporter (DMT)-like permease
MRVVFSLMCVYLFWGGTYLGIRYAIQTIPPFLMVGMRFTVAGWALYAVMRLRGEPRPTWPEIRNAALIGFLLLVLGNGILTLAEQQVPSAIASLMIATVPLWIAVITSIINRRLPGAGSSAGILLGLVGVGILVLNPASLSDHPVSAVGIIAILFAALAWSVGSILSRRIQQPKAPLLSTAVQMIAVGAILLIVAAVDGDMNGFSFAQVSGESWLAVGYLIIFGSLLGYTAFIWLFRYADTTVASTYAYVNPVVAIMLGWLIAGERFGTNAIIAAVIIIISVIVITVSRRDAKPQSQKAPIDAEGASASESISAGARAGIDTSDP